MTMTMTEKQLERLEKRIATLKEQNRIVWFEGMSKDVPIRSKGSNGAIQYFAYAASLNVNGGSWYYVIRWVHNSWQCSCEAVKPCKHEEKLKAMLFARYLPQRAKREKEIEDAAMRKRVFAAQPPVVHETPEEERRHIAPYNRQGFSLMR